RKVVDHQQGQIIESCACRRIVPDFLSHKLAQRLQHGFAVEESTAHRERHPIPPPLPAVRRPQLDRIQILREHRVWCQFLSRELMTDFPKSLARPSPVAFKNGREELISKA